jgi:hypothetical protein
MATTERIPLLVTPAQKALFIKKAKASKFTVNEFVRRAAEVYNPSDDDDAMLRLVAKVKQTTHEATVALHAALKSCADSNRRIADMEIAHLARSKQMSMMDKLWDAFSTVIKMNDKVVAGSCDGRSAGED